MNDNSNEGDEKCINLKGFTNRTVGFLNKQKKIDQKMRTKSL